MKVRERSNNFARHDTYFYIELPSTNQGLGTN